MGLDISLYSTADTAAQKAHSAAWDEVYDSGRWDQMTKDEQSAWRDANPYPRRDDHPSERYPGHLFNRRYLRSSYNGGGFNHAVPEMLGSAGRDGTAYPNEYGSLYWIFEPLGRDWENDEGALTAADLPKLAECRKRAEKLAEELRSCDRLRVLTVSPNMFSKQPTFTDDDSLRLYREHIAERGVPSPDDWYSNRDLEVFGEGLSILAAVAGMATFGIPGVHLIYRAGAEGFESYVQSAEIVAEFCDEAAALIERDGSCDMSWSG